MTKAKRNVLDELAEGVRQILEDLDRLINPDKHRKPAPVPIPVRPRPDRQHDDPYRR